MLKVQALLFHCPKANSKWDYNLIASGCNEVNICITE